MSQTMRQEHRADHMVLRWFGIGMPINLIFRGGCVLFFRRTKEYLLFALIRMAGLLFVILSLATLLSACESSSEINISYKANYDLNGFLMDNTFPYKNKRVAALGVGMEAKALTDEDVAKLTKTIGKPDVWIERRSKGDITNTYVYVIDKVSASNCVSSDRFLNVIANSDGNVLKIVYVSGSQTRTLYEKKRMDGYATYGSCQ